MKKKKSIKRSKKQVRKNYSIKANAEEMALIKSKAKKYSGGKVSPWLVFAGINYVPKRGDLA